MPLLDARLIIEGIASGDKRRWKDATYAIAEFDHDTEVDESVFVAALASSNDDVVFWSEIALEHLGERGAAAIPTLVSLLKREQLFLRQTAVKALAAVGPRDDRARAAVFAAFGDPSPFVRREALQASIDLPALAVEELAAIAGMATDPDEEVANWSEIALRNIRVRAQKNA